MKHLGKTPLCHNANQIRDEQNFHSEHGFFRLIALKSPQCSLQNRRAIYAISGCEMNLKLISQFKSNVKISEFMDVCEDPGQFLSHRSM